VLYSRPRITWQSIAGSAQGKQTDFHLPGVLGLKQIACVEIIFLSNSELAGGSSKSSQRDLNAYATPRKYMV
jgi:hypothetical protein